MSQEAFIRGLTKCALANGATTDQVPELLKLAFKIPGLGAAKDLMRSPTTFGKVMGAGAGGAAAGLGSGYMAGSADEPAPQPQPDKLQQILSQISQFAQQNPYAAPVGLGALGAGIGAGTADEEEGDDTALRGLAGAGLGVGGGLGLNYLLNRGQQA